MLKSLKCHCRYCKLLLKLHMRRLVISSLIRLSVPVIMATFFILKSLPHKLRFAQQSRPAVRKRSRLSRCSDST